jgi:hypothetical protein
MMSSRWLTVLLVSMVVAGVRADDALKPGPDPRPKTLADQIAAIKSEHQEREKKFFEDLLTFRDDDKKNRELNDDYRAFVTKQIDKLKGLIKDHAKEPDVFEGFLVLVGKLRCFDDEQLVSLLLKDHLSHPKMGELCFELRYFKQAATERVLKEVVAKHPQEAVRGLALYALGDYHRPDSWEQVSEAEKGKRLAEAERCYAEVAKTYADVPMPDGRGKLGPKATSELLRIKNLPNLTVGKTAPDIVGEDIDGKPLKLSDFRGKVVVLNFWGHW